MSDLGGLDNLPPPTGPSSQGASGEQDAYLPSSNWSYGNTVLALVGGIIIAPFIGVIIYSLLATGSADPEDIPTNLLLAIQVFGGFGFLLFLTLRRGTGSWRTDYGFAIEPRHIWGLMAGMVLQVAVALLTFPLVQTFAEDDGPQQEIAQIAAGLTGIEIALFALFVAVLTPVFEEIVFRGMLLGRLVKRFSRRWAAVISAAAFAATHLLDPNALLVVPGLFIVGLALAYMAYYSKNLSLPIFAHMGVNGLAVLLLAYADEIDELSETVEGLIHLVL